MDGAKSVDHVLASSTKEEVQLYIKAVEFFFANWWFVHDKTIFFGC